MNGLGDFLRSNRAAQPRTVFPTILVLSEKMFVAWLVRSRLHVNKMITESTPVECGRKDRRSVKISLAPI
jgi:hypothetical protein